MRVVEKLEGVQKICRTTQAQKTEPQPGVEEYKYMPICNWRLDSGLYQHISVGFKASRLGDSGIKARGRRRSKNERPEIRLVKNGVVENWPIGRTIRG